MSESSTSAKTPSWRAMHADTDAWAEELQLQFFRTAPAWRKLELAGDLIAGTLLLTQRGLEQRHPQASAEQIKRMLADLMLGEELAARVYGPHNP